jgi:hypothetical protein
MRRNADSATEIERFSAGDEVDLAVKFAEGLAGRAHDGGFHNDAVQVRIKAARQAKATAQPRPDWPPSIQNPFPDCHGIPEIEASELDGRLLGGAILHHGSLIVRGLVERSVALSMADSVDRLFEAFQAWKTNPDTLGPWFSPVDIPALETRRLRDNQDLFGGVMICDSPMLFRQVMSLYTNSLLVSAIAEYLGEQPVLSLGKTMARRVTPSPHPGVFHQDGAFLGNIRTVNSWIAFSDCGVEAPGIELVDRRLPGIVQTEVNGSYFTVNRETAIAANEGKAFARPVFRAGDAILFDEITLHATGQSPDMTATRRALESWFFAPSACTDYVVPFSL